MCGFGLLPADFKFNVIFLYPNLVNIISHIMQTYNQVCHLGCAQQATGTHTLENIAVLFANLHTSNLQVSVHLKYVEVHTKNVMHET